MQPDRIEIEAPSPRFVFIRISGSPNAQRVDEYLAWMTQHLRAAPPAITIIDGTHSSLTDAGFVRRQGEWIAKNRELIAQRSLGTALVLGSPLLRFTLSSIFLIARPPAPLTVHDSVANAARWAQQQLAARGVSVPVSLLQLAA